jgi:hypothetical protein
MVAVGDNGASAGSHDVQSARGGAPFKCKIEMILKTKGGTITAVRGTPKGPQ